MAEEYTCIECENLYDDRDGDTDERICNKCGCQIYEELPKDEKLVFEEQFEPTTADEHNKEVHPDYGPAYSMANNSGNKKE